MLSRLNLSDSRLLYFMNRLRFVFSRLLSTALLICAIAVVSLAQEQPLPIKYWLSMSHPVSHLFEVTIEVTLPVDANLQSLDFQMPKWSPGRYAVFDFAKNVQEVGAQSLCAAGQECEQVKLPITRMDDQTWRVQTGGFKLMGNIRAFRFSYKVFANDLSGTFSQLDSHHANINGGCVFMYVVNHKQDRVGLSINAPPGWRVVNGRSEK